MFKRIKVLFVKAEYTLRKRTAGAKLNLFKNFLSGVRRRWIECESNVNQDSVRTRCVACHLLDFNNESLRIRRSFAPYFKFSF